MEVDNGCDTGVVCFLAQPRVHTVWNHPSSAVPRLRGQGRLDLCIHYNSSLAEQTQDAVLGLLSLAGHSVLGLAGGVLDGVDVVLPLVASGRGVPFLTCT